MVRRSGRTDVPRHRARQYRRVARGLAESAEALHALADEGDRYGNAIGVLSVHAAIAWVDALTIAYGGVKHTGADHGGAADLLLETVPESRMSADARRKLRAVLRSKDEVSYMGQFYSVEDAMRLLIRLRAFTQWAHEVFERRP